MFIRQICHIYFKTLEKLLKEKRWKKYNYNSTLYFLLVSLKFNSFKTEAVVAIFGYTFQLTFLSLFDSPVSSFSTTESMAIVFSSSLLPILALFGLIDREPAQFIATSRVEISSKMNNNLLPLDPRKYMRSEFLINHSWNTSLLEFLTIIGFSKAFI